MCTHPGLASKGSGSRASRAARCLPSGCRGARGPSAGARRVQVRASNLQELVYKQGQAGVTKASVSIVFNNADKASSPVGYEQHDQVTVTRQVRPRAPVRAGPAVGRRRAAARCSEAALAAASVLACCCSSPPRCARGLPVCRASLGLGPH